LKHFDIFIVRQWYEGYTLKVDITRPHNAPRRRHTKADFKRRTAVNRKNIELNERMFTWDEVVEEIKRLQIPEERDTTSV